MFAADLFTNTTPSLVCVSPYFAFRTEISGREPHASNASDDSSTIGINRGETGCEDRDGDLSCDIASNVCAPARKEQMNPYCMVYYVSMTWKLLDYLGIYSAVFVGMHLCSVEISSAIL
jgi:hypothetical protein